MMVNIGTRVATVIIVFSTSRNAVLIQLKMFQNIKLPTKLHHCTLSELKTSIFSIIKRFCLPLKNLPVQETKLKHGRFAKSDSNTTQKYSNKVFE